MGDEFEDCDDTFEGCEDEEQLEWFRYPRPLTVMPPTQGAMCDRPDSKDIEALGQLDVADAG